MAQSDNIGDHVEDGLRAQLVLDAAAAAAARGAWIDVPQLTA